jgi:hypothetical protein
MVHTLFSVSWRRGTAVTIYKPVFITELFLARRVRRRYPDHNNRLSRIPANGLTSTPKLQTIIAHTCTGYPRASGRAKRRADEVATYLGVHQSTLVQGSTSDYKSVQQSLGHQSFLK